MLRIGILTVASVALIQAQALTLVEARTKIGAAVNDPKVMAETTAALNAADQVTFLGQVNEAIGKLPGSEESRTQKYYAANKAALTNAKKGNLSALLAETYATVSVESLEAINGKLAKELFNRSTGSGLTDAQFVQIAEANLAKIEKRTAGSDDAAQRKALAIKFFVSASNGSPANLENTLANGGSDAKARETAKNSPAKTEKSGEAPVVVDIQNFGANAGRMSLLTELAAPIAKDAKPGQINNPAVFGGGAFGLNGASDGDNLANSGFNRVPRWVGANDGWDEDEGTRDPGKLPNRRGESVNEPGGYQNQYP